jgi:putative glutamine amidotransferase
MIGITTCERPGHDQSPNEWIYRQYISAVTLAGSEVLLIEAMEDPTSPKCLQRFDHALERIDGLLVPGGFDVQPESYGQLRQPETQNEGSRNHDDSNIYAIKRAEERAMPLLAMCRGLQIFNVACGGTLHQHLPRVVGTAVRHDSEDPQFEDKCHPVTIDGDSILGGILSASGVTTYPWYSHHHQGVNVMGENLEAIAWAPDGVVEALQTTKPGWFALAVQTHFEQPDMYPVFRIVFDEFIRQAALQQHQRTREYRSASPAFAI